MSDYAGNIAEKVLNTQSARVEHAMRDHGDIIRTLVQEAARDGYALGYGAGSAK